MELRRRRRPQAGAPRARRQGARSSSSTTPTSRPPCTARSPASLINTGQDCTAATRAYVQRPLYDAFVAGVADLMGTVRLGDPFDPRDRPGPADLATRSRSASPASSTGPAATGAKVVCGGAVPGGALAAGRLLRAHAGRRRRPGGPRSSRTRSSARCSSCCRSTPTTRARAGQRHAVRPGRVRLDAATSSGPCAPRREIRAGCVWINDHIPIISEMPHGGYKASGFGKDMSPYSFEEYTNVKHVMYDGTAVARKDWHRTDLHRQYRQRPTSDRGTAPERARGDPHVTRHAARPEFRQLVRARSPGARLLRGAGGAGARRRPRGLRHRQHRDGRRAQRQAQGPVRHRQGRQLVATGREYIDVDDKTKKHPTLDDVHSSRPASRSTTPRTSTTTTSSSPRSSRSSANGQDIGRDIIVPHRLDGRPADPPGLGPEARPGEHPERRRT